MRTITEKLADDEIPSMTVQEWMDRIEAATIDRDRPQCHRKALMNLWDRVDELIDETAEYEI